MENLINRIINKEYINFKRKLKSNEYISNYLYQKIKDKYKDLMPMNFNLEKYNEKVLEKEYLKYKEYQELGTMFIYWLIKIKTNKVYL